MGNFITGVISLTVSAVILATVFITQVKNSSSGCSQYLADGNCTTWGTWSASELAMWGLISLIAIVGMVYGVLNVFGLA